jgi:hypothetical protein
MTDLRANKRSGIKIISRVVFLIKLDNMINALKLQASMAITLAVIIGVSTLFFTVSS